jgi:hypothetical protein
MLTRKNNSLKRTDPSESSLEPEAGFQQALVAGD